ncbi:MAG: phosphopantetheine adenylyltransferase [Candidatus Bathyarchaeia archaeon]
MSRKFAVVAVGGTFDEFHKGHRALLMKAFEVGNRVLIGLCSDDFARKLRKPHKVAAYEERLEDLKEFLRRHGMLDRAEVIPLRDPYGVTLSSGCLDAIVVSRETEPRAYEINEKRRARGLPPLGVIVIEMIPAEDRVPISTTRIRRREIDREGRLLKS